MDIPIRKYVTPIGDLLCSVKYLIRELSLFMLKSLLVLLLKVKICKLFDIAGVLAFCVLYVFISLRFSIFVYVNKFACLRRLCSVKKKERSN